MKTIRRKKAHRAPVPANGSSVPPSPARRAFLGKLGAAATVGAAALASPGVASAHSERDGGNPSVQAPDGVTNGRVLQAFQLRVSEATADALAGPARNVSNGDDALYPDKAGTYTKGLLHDSFGRVDPSSYASFKKALHSGKFSDFEDIIAGGTRTQNGPQGAYAFDLEALDNSQFGQPQVPPAPKLASDQTATELVEHYWGALLHRFRFQRARRRCRRRTRRSAHLPGAAQWQRPRHPQSPLPRRVSRRNARAVRFPVPSPAHLYGRPTHQPAVADLSPRH